jgi:hypothetical protein
VTAAQLATFVELTVAARQARKICLGSCLREKEQVAMDALKDAIEQAEIELERHRLRDLADLEVRNADRRLGHVNPLIAQILAPLAGGSR